MSDLVLGKCVCRKLNVWLKRAHFFTSSLIVNRIHIVYCISYNMQKRLACTVAVKLFVKPIFAGMLLSSMPFVLVLNKTMQHGKPI